MTKRRLSQQQLRRIRGQQNARGNRRADKGAAEQHDAIGPEQAGLVVCQYGKQLDVEALDGKNAGKLFRCYRRSNLPALVTGDRVIWQADSRNSGVVVAQQPRKTVMHRPSSRGALRAIAANIDCVVIVVAPLPEPFGNLIDRYLVAIEHLGLQPVILLNKADLLKAEAAAPIRKLLTRYARIGYETLTASCVQAGGIDALKALLADKTAVFVGQSGVGKSSLINALRGVSNDGEDTATVGDLSAGHIKGTHTTTASRLYHLPGSGDLIDSPGIREFGLWHIDANDLMKGFVEFSPYAGQCRFRDCQHQQEPGCALRTACENGSIDPVRLASYHQILRSLKNR